MVTFALLRVFAVVLLVAANAFFVAAEFALVAIRDTRIQQLIEQGRIGARTVQKLHRRLDELLPAIQLGVTLASLALGWIGEPTVAHLLEPYFEHIPYAGVYAHIVAVTIAFALITFMHVLLGEVVPKTLALQRAERVALAVSGPMDFFITIFKPFLITMRGSARYVLRVFGLHEMREGGVHSPEELKMIVTASRRVGLLPAEQEEIIHKALDLNSLTAREIMTPRPDIYSVASDMPLEEAFNHVVEEQHSRVPVYDPKRGPEHIIGVLYAKDLMRIVRYRLAQGPGADLLRSMTTQVRHVMRDVLLVPESKPVPDLLLDFQKRKRHLAVVVDEFGSTAGVVSVEDVLEQLVGEIEDEYDVAKQVPFDLAGPMVLEGSASVLDLETQYHIELPRDEGFETLAGFILYRLQRVPKEGESFVHEGRRYTVLQMDHRRIATVQIEPVPEPKPAAEKKAESPSITTPHD